MAIVDKVLGKLLGNKSVKDIKKIQPLISVINDEVDKLLNISNDQLRDKTNELRKEIQDYFKEEQSEIDSLKNNIENDKFDLTEREEVYKKIDKLEDDIDNKIETKLDQILPPAFAIMKETARRYKENAKIEVTANDFDRELAVNRDDIVIKGNKAIYHNQWRAGGPTITWDMVHYDVQLIGGIILHQGKIAEMATG
ncbi:MAG: preprotein translocase subunit SecA, partial [Bacteroidetes bacterium]